MSLHNKKWLIEKNKENNLNLDMHPLIQKILVNRGYDSQKAIENFLNPSLHQLYDPF